MTIHITSYAYGHGATDSGCADGPKVIQSSPYLQLIPMPLHWEKTLHSNDEAHGTAALTAIAALCHSLAEFIAAMTVHHEPFLTLGGDHSCAIGTWSGAAHALNSSEAVGLIWFDAHMDSHTFNTTPSNNIHGMPLAVLLGYGETELTHLLSPTPKLLPQNVVLIGARSYESGEEVLLKKLGVRIFYMDEVKSRGINAVMSDAIEIVNKNTQYFGISIDLDGLDPSEAPGVGSPVRGGVLCADFIESLHLIAQEPHFIGADIAEFNPHLDKEHKTEKIVCQIVQALY